MPNYDIRDIVDRLDPDRHLPSVEYEFSNGRKFKAYHGAWYPPYIYDEFGNAILDEDGNPLES